MKKASHPFKPRARMLLALGNQLIKDEGLALFELVKNSYDADATKVIVSLSNISKSNNILRTPLIVASGMLSL